MRKTSVFLSRTHKAAAAVPETGIEYGCGASRTAAGNARHACCAAQHLKQAVGQNVCNRILVPDTDIDAATYQELRSERQQELLRFRKCTASEKLYMVCGDDGGYRNERYVGQIVTGIVTDERWYRETAYLEQYPNLHRPRNKPYYFVEFSARKVRLIFLSSYASQIDEQEELFEKSCQYGAEQLVWLKKEALDLPAGWTVLVFSHAVPKSRFETGQDPWNYMNYSSEPAMMLLRQAQKRGILPGGWFAGQYACDYETTFCHIPYFLIDSVRPQPVKSAFPDVRKHTERKLGTKTEDLWDVLLLKPEQRRIHLLRFGAGEDRVFDY